ncbi:hypothetical protein OVA29_05505 [Exiguobacterium sp. SL14]|nr:hypothetical protein [Exiguobacterium sp. SL14]MCY1690298.1 hypothetical protein [Exiguobacterium sp. SL14]
MIPIAILMKLYDLDSRFEKNPLEMTKRFGEHQALDYAHVYRRWEAGELFPGETLIRPKKWWQVMKKTEVIQLPGKQLSRRAFDKWYKKRLELQKLLNVTGGAGEDDIWRIPLKRHLDFYQMLHLLNEQYAMFYRAVIQYQVGEVELSPFIVGPSAIYIMEWLDGDESIYHIRMRQIMARATVQGISETNLESEHRFKTDGRYSPCCARARLCLTNRTRHPSSFRLF